MLGHDCHSIVAGEGHAKTLVKENIKGELDLLFSANDGERDKMLTTNTELDKWIEQL